MKGIMGMDIDWDLDERLEIAAELCRMNPGIARRFSPSLRDALATYLADKAARQATNNACAASPAGTRTQGA